MIISQQYPTDTDAPYKNLSAIRAVDFNGHITGKCPSSEDVLSQYTMHRSLNRID